jgi:succinate dehydrogenase / fumarate reductase cytochrome b subunit
VHAGWWAEHVAAPMGGSKFDPKDVATAPRAIQASWWIVVFYGVGTLACAYHLANGLWTMGITWGLLAGPNSQRWANVPCAALGLFLAVVGMAALVSMATINVPSTAPAIETDVERGVRNLFRDAHGGPAPGQRFLTLFFRKVI